MQVPCLMPQLQGEPCFERMRRQLSVLSKAKRALYRTMDSKTELQRARSHTDALFELVAPETLYERPIPARHRLIFYVGHLEAFDWNQLARGVLGKPSFDPTFDTLFEAGIDPPPGQAPQDTAGRLADARSGARVTLPARARRSMKPGIRFRPSRQQMVLEHRWMHAETICYLLHQLDPALKTRPAADRPLAAPAPIQSVHSHTGGHDATGAAER